jgi:hypothetical protein
MLVARESTALSADASFSLCTLLIVAFLYIAPTPGVGQPNLHPNSIISGGPCQPPQIAMTPFDGGLVRVDISSPCGKRALVSIKNGDVGYVGELNEQGRWQLTLDAFQSNSELIFDFGGKLEIRRRLEHPQLEMLSKVAIAWLDNIDLDLHAFEPPGPDGNEQHVSARNARSYEEAVRSGSAQGQSRGFISTTGNGRAFGSNLEVYTLVHQPRERRGVVRMAIEHVSRGHSPADDYCGSGTKAAVSLDVYVMRHGRQLRRLERTLDSVPCGSILTSESALVTKLVPDLVLGGP